MPKAPGSSDPTWKAVESLNNTFPSFLKWLTKYNKKSLEVLAGILDDPEAMQQLRYGAAKEVIAMNLKFFKEFKGARSQDFVRESDYEVHKKLLEKEKKAGVLDLDEFKTGTR